MNHSDSGLAHGTSGSPQTTIENTQAEQKAKENEQSVKTGQANSDNAPYSYNHDEVINAINSNDTGFLRSKLSQTSPIAIPANATIKPEPDKNGYKQVKYKWTQNEYKYESRWHTHTPNAPEYSHDSWVVERIRPGIGTGKNHRPKIHEVLIGENKWIDWGKWDTAKKARRRGNETKEQRELLDSGHWQV